MKRRCRKPGPASPPKRGGGGTQSIQNMTRAALPSIHDRRVEPPAALPAPKSMEPDLRNARKKRPKPHRQQNPLHFLDAGAPTPHKNPPALRPTRNQQAVVPGTGPLTASRKRSPNRAHQTRPTRTKLCGRRRQRQTMEATAITTGCTPYRSAPVPAVIRIASRHAIAITLIARRR